MSNIQQIKIDGTDVFLENINEGQGKITISDTYGHNYSCYWGAMGGNLKTFISEINSDYFAGKLIPVDDENVIDTKKTFASLRKYIREEIDLPFYKEMEFQKDLRKKLNEFQNECEEYGSNHFIHNFHSFTKSLDYYLIDNRYDQREIEDSFSSISECWYFIVEKPSRNHIWLKNFHTKLKKQL